MKSKVTAILLALFICGVAYAQPSSQPTNQPAATAPSGQPDAALPAPSADPPPAAGATAKAPESASQEASEDGAKQSDQTTQAWWKAVLVFFIELSKALLVPILVVLGWVANKKWKLGLERETIEWVVSKAAGFGEQKAKVALKAGKPMQGPKILEEALKHGESLLITKGLADKWGDKLADLIEAKLGEQELAKKDAPSKTAEPDAEA